MVIPRLSDGHRQCTEARQPRNTDDERSRRTQVVCVLGTATGHCETSPRTDWLRPTSCSRRGSAPECFGPSPVAAAEAADDDETGIGTRCTVTCWLGAPRPRLRFRGPG